MKSENVPLEIHRQTSLLGVHASFRGCKDDTMSVLWGGSCEIRSWIRSMIFCCCICWKTPPTPHRTLPPDLQLATEGPQHRWQFESSIAWAQKPLAKRFGLGAGTAVATHGAQLQGEALRRCAVGTKTEMVFLLG